MYTLQEISEQENVLVIDPSINILKENSYAYHFEKLISGNHKVLTLDLSMIEAISATGLMRILILKNRLLLAGRALRIKGCGDGMCETIRFLKMNRFLSFENQ